MNLFKLKPREPESDDENSVEGERELTSVNKGISLQNRITNWAVILGLCAFTGVLLYKYYAGMYKDYESKKAPIKDISRTVATTTLPPLTMPEPEQVPAPAAKAGRELPPVQSATPPVVSGNAPSGAQAPVKSQAELVRERRLKRELRFNLEGTFSNTSAAEVAHADVVSAAPAAGQSDTQKRNAKAIPAATFSAVHAYMVPDPTLIMTRGKVIPCTVIPAIDTTLAGNVTCITAEDATGADNKVSLMDRGTICIGQQGGGVIQGQRRVGVIWQRCETPQHVLVPLDSNATDALGRPGIPGQVDNHFWDRFGAAIALSLISDIGPYLVASRQGDGNNNTTIAFPNILNGPETVISEVLKNTMDIRPTITSLQSVPALIYLAEDIDFRDVYQLERSQ